MRTGIIHRDIKPQNIIMSRDGKVKVTDFGIAKVADSTTVTTTAAGTVHYISPEQARGGYSDERSDIYSLGITMYEMVTGRVCLLKGDQCGGCTDAYSERNYTTETVGTIHSGQL